jgi:hypothetical protein
MVVDEANVACATQYLRRSILKAMGYRSKCIEAVAAEDRTRVAGVPTRRSNHLAKSPRGHTSLYLVPASALEGHYLRVKAQRSIVQDW